MTEDLARSERSTARGGWHRPRPRLAPGPLRPATLRHSPPGIVRGMITGALLAVGVLAAFTLPFLREGSAPARPQPPAPRAGPAALLPAQPPGAGGPEAVREAGGSDGITTAGNALPEGASRP